MKLGCLLNGKTSKLYGTGPAEILLELSCGESIAMCLNAACSSFEYARCSRPVINSSRDHRSARSQAFTKGRFPSCYEGVRGTFMARRAAVTNRLEAVPNDSNVTVYRQAMLGS
jgi:hypothetical protein